MPNKVLLKLLLALTWTLAVEAMRDCSRDIPASCTENRNIQLTKKTDHYDLQLCSNGRCVPAAGQERWIRCNRMCETCTSMAGGSSCGEDEDQCERRVSTFLDNYCRSNIPSTSTTTTTVQSTVTITTSQVVTTTLPRQIVSRTSTTTVTIELTKTTTVNITTSPTCDVITSAMSSQESMPVQPIEFNNGQLGGSANKAPVAALGALLGLSMILLAIVTAGWVWTLWAMKRKKSEKSASKANISNGDRTMNRCFPNPTYEINTTTQEPPQTETEATYDEVASPGQTKLGTTGNGQTYAKLNRPKRNGNKPPRGMPSQQVNDDYSQLGLVNEDAENNYSLAGWEKEGGHGGGDYADPDMEAEMVGGATEYEVPMPLCKNK